jgi:hypothetical protein
MPATPKVTSGRPSRIKSKSKVKSTKPRRPSRRSKEKILPGGGFLSLPEITRFQKEWQDLPLLKAPFKYGALTLKDKSKLKEAETAINTQLNNLEGEAMTRVVKNLVNYYNAVVAMRNATVAKYQAQLNKATTKGKAAPALPPQLKSEPFQWRDTAVF